MQPASLNGVARSQSGQPAALVLRDCSLPVLEKQEVVRQEAGTNDNNHLCSGWGWSIFSSNWLLGSFSNYPSLSVKLTRETRNQPELPSHCMHLLLGELKQMWLTIILNSLPRTVTVCYGLNMWYLQTHDFQLSIWWWLFPLRTCMSVLY